MATKKHMTLTYKVGASYILTKTPKTLEFLKNVTFRVDAANSRDVKFGGHGVLVVSRGDIKRKLFTFEPTVDIKPDPVEGQKVLQPFRYRPAKELSDADKKAQIEAIEERIRNYRGGDMTDIIEDIKITKCIQQVAKLFTVDQLKGLITTFPSLLIIFAKDHPKVLLDVEFRNQAIELFRNWEPRVDLFNMVLNKLKAQYQF